MTVPEVAPDGRSLVGRTVRLDLAQDADTDELFAVLDDDRVYEMGYSGNKPRPRSAADWQTWIDAARAAGRMMYIVRALDGAGSAGTIIGTSSLGDIDMANAKAHIGWTAYSPSAWGTSVNPECKLLLLTHCFKDCGLGRVKLRTDLINTRSQAAIAKLGATREGVARRHIRRADGTWRSSVIYSVIVEDWADVKAGLERRLEDVSGRASADVSRET
jgi:RimJ/RimL family protein N-acetyltransferase